MRQDRYRAQIDARHHRHQPPRPGAPRRIISRLPGGPCDGPRPNHLLHCTFGLWDSPGSGSPCWAARREAVQTDEKGNVRPTPLTTPRHQRADTEQTERLRRRRIQPDQTRLLSVPRLGHHRGLRKKQGLRPQGPPSGGSIAVITQEKIVLGEDIATRGGRGLVGEPMAGSAC